MCAGVCIYLCLKGGGGTSLTCSAGNRRLCLDVFPLEIVSGYFSAGDCVWMFFHWRLCLGVFPLEIVSGCFSTG